MIYSSSKMNTVSASKRPHVLDSRKEEFELNVMYDVLYPRRCYDGQDMQYEWFLTWCKLKKMGASSIPGFEKVCPSYPYGCEKFVNQNLSELWKLAQAYYQ